MKKMILIFILGIFMVSCSGASTKSNDLDLVGTNWKLEKYSSEDKLVGVVEGSVANMIFTDERISGSTGVNNYFSSYTLGEEKSLKFGHAGSTMMAGQPEAMKQEHAFLTSIEKIDSYTIVGDRLTLLSKDIVIMTFLGEEIKEEKKNGGVSFGVGVGIGL